MRKSCLLQFYSHSSIFMIKVIRLRKPIESKKVKNKGLRPNAYFWAMNNVNNRLNTILNKIWSKT
ncbi:MAG: hypothetical protein ACI9N3_001214 [Colwellia sp.]|jgi:hypothetical protein